MRVFDSLIFSAHTDISFQTFYNRGRKKILQNILAFFFLLAQAIYVHKNISHGKINIKLVLYILLCCELLRDPIKFIINFPGFKSKWTGIRQLTRILLHAALWKGYCYGLEQSLASKDLCHHAIETARPEKYFSKTGIFCFIAGPGDRRGSSIIPGVPRKGELV